LLRELLLIDDLSRHGIDHLDDIGHRPSFQSGQTRSTVNQTVPIPPAAVRVRSSAVGHRWLYVLRVVVAWMAWWICSTSCPLVIAALSCG
ncbi:hypothetical protein, partial [Microbacterium aoyamense]|uniref:hypothetical protein n=1 Tax=Microbacterium aoyamense TaxID=344166 RepID=UPI002004AE40